MPPLFPPNGKKYFAAAKRQKNGNVLARMFIPIPPERVRVTESQEVPFRFEVSINSGGKWPIPPIFQTETE
jgi:hypothetical protein